MAVLQSQLRLSLIDQVTARARAINGSLSRIRASQSALLGTFGRVAAFGGAYLGVTKGISATAGAAMEVESAFADVRKVVNANDEQFENMRRTIRQMSNELPISATGIAELFAAAGESGVATKDLREFSAMAARVGIAFDMSAGEAGTALAKLKTQLGLTVADTGSLADAINHLSNNMASKAKDVTDYMLRVGALAEMGGFAKEEIAAIGSAMIAAGAQSETAGTAMQNVVKAMTRGEFAKKSQKEAAKALGLDLPTISKQMQKDAPKALKQVLTAISKAPKYNHIALLSQFFGDEAKAFAPLIGNIGLLDQALDSVSDTTKYAGSAYREYVQRANTTANVLQILGNRFTNLGMAIGDRMLPYIKAAALEIGEIFDTLGERVTVFDRIGIAIQGFANGIGSGTLRQIIDDMKEFLFGKVDGSAAGDEAGRIFAKFKEWGVSVKEFSAAVANNPLVKFFADIAPYGFQIMLWSTGILMLAGTVMKLGRALMFLSGASAIISTLKVVGALAGVAGGGGIAAILGTGAAATGASTGGAATAGFLAKALGLARLTVAGLAAGGAYVAGKETYTGDTPYSQGKAWLPSPTDALHWLGSTLSSMNDKMSAPAQVSSVYGTMALDGANRARMAGMGGSTENLPGKTKDDIAINASSIAALTRPQGTQDVRVTNQQPPNVTVNAPITITGVADGTAAGTSAANQLGAKVKAAVESSYMDSR